MIPSGQALLSRDLVLGTRDGRGVIYDLRFTIFFVPRPVSRVPYFVPCFVPRPVFHCPSCTLAGQPAGK